MFFRLRPLLALSAASHILWTTTVSAQETGGGSVFEGSPRTSVVDIAVVVVLVGLALFAICRSSRRT